MNEYARLAKAKPVEARTTSELLAAVFDLDEETAKSLQIKIDQSRSVAEAVRFMRTRRVNASEMAELLEELRKRKNPDSVKDGRPTIQSCNDVVSQAIEIRDKKKEYLLAFFLNARNQLISKEIISIGTLTASLAHPREIFAPAIGKAAAGVILAHNHPSGDPSPSEEDMRLTKRVSQAGHILGIELLDHLIIAEQGSYSFKAAGVL